MKIDDRFPARVPLTVEIGESAASRTALRDSVWVDRATAVGITRAGIIIVPWERFRDLEKPVFPVGTGDLYHALNDNAGADVGVELAASDEHYSEVALHADVVFLPTMFLSAVAVPLAVNLISEWLKKRLLERAKDADVKFEMHIEEPDGRTKSLRYEGPVSSFESLIQAQLRQSNSLVPETTSKTTDLQSSEPKRLEDMPDMERSDDSQ